MLMKPKLNFEVWSEVFALNVHRNIEILSLERVKAAVKDLLEKLNTKLNNKFRKTTDRPPQNHIICS